jgi:hypothetical protein
MGATIYVTSGTTSSIGESRIFQAAELNRSSQKPGTEKVIISTFDSRSVLLWFGNSSLSVASVTTKIGYIENINIAAQSSCVYLNRSKKKKIFQVS